MFRSLSYSVTFPTGRTLSADLTFDPDFYAIVGSNESGKTMILEMLRFSLFGTQALRGVADDYKNLKVRACFDIRGETYEVERTMKAATLCKAGQAIASSVTGVNDKIYQLLGFGLPVFDVANSINQGEVERLGSMSPAERKRLVDGVLGIDALDIVVKWAVEEARLMEREAETIRRGLVVPVAPIEPEGYVPSAQIPLEQLTAEARELAKLQGFLAVQRSEPVKPQPPCAETVEDLRPLATTRAELRRNIANEEAQVAVLPVQAPEVPDDIEAQWDAYDAYQQAQQHIHSNPRPRHHLMQLRVFQDDWTALKNINARAALAAHIERLKEEGSRPCPHCGGDIPLEQDQIERLQAEHDGLPVPNHGVVPPTPPIPPDEIERQIAYCRTWSSSKFEEANRVPAADKPTIERHMISVLRAQVQQAAQRERLVQVLEGRKATLTAMGDWEEMLARREAYDRALDSYTTAYREWLDWIAERAGAQSRAAELEGAEERLTEAAALHAAALEYERAQARFEAAKVTYDEGVGRADALEADAEQHRKVNQLMVVLRSLIKQHLMPSLNKVASHLLREMTGGQRNSIFVDENFNVMVDGQRLDTLSGSGKACTNLAIRIALGQVLTNRVFSVLLADEIDASMDDFRAQNTSNVLDTLNNTISQILLVSHKPIEATNVIQLGASFDFGTGDPGTL